MKTLVVSKVNYKDELEKGDYYECVHTFKTDETRSGVAVVINTEDALLVYDSEFFR